jgi:hypothetical protein
MISVFNPDSDLISVISIEDVLSDRGCVKIGHCTKRGCVWIAPSGKHLTAPNPATYSKVPPDTLDDLLAILEALSV